MRKVIVGLLFVVFCISTSFLIFGIVKKLRINKQISENILRLPIFSFATLSNESFCSSEISEGPVLVVLFHPECEHCKYEISSILESSIPKSDAIVILVSSAKSESIRSFLNQYTYSVYPNFIPLVDTLNIFGEIFGSDIIPTNYIYSKELDLVEVLYGEVKTEAILKYFETGE